MKFVWFLLPRFAVLRFSSSLHFARPVLCVFLDLLPIIFLPPLFLFLPAFHPSLISHTLTCFCCYSFCSVLFCSVLFCYVLFCSVPPRSVLFYVEVAVAVLFCSAHVSSKPFPFPFPFPVSRFDVP